jgi:hypothetical protein
LCWTNQPQEAQAAAGLAVGLHVLAQQRLGEGFDEAGLADAGRAVEQDRVRQALAHGLQLGPGGLLPRVITIVTAISPAPR